MNRLAMSVLFAVIAGQMLYWGGVATASGHYWGSFLVLPGSAMIAIEFVRAAANDRSSVGE
jgi:hypothetical protein